MWKANKLISYLLWALALISVVLCVQVFYATGSLDPRIETQKVEMLSVINPIFMWCYALIGLTIALTVILPIPALVQNPKSALGIIGGIAALGLVILVSYMMSSTEALPFAPGHAPVTAQTLAYADVNMISTYIVFGGTILVLIGTGLIDVLKMR